MDPNNVFQLAFRFLNISGRANGIMFITDTQVISGYSNITVGSNITIEGTEYTINSIQLIIHNELFSPNDSSYTTVSTGSAFPYNATLQIDLK